MEAPPTAESILAAHQRIMPFIHKTPVLSSKAINEMTGAEVFFKCENFQKVGAFKARGATNAIRTLSPALLKKGVATHSSGNHAQALSWAAKLAGIPAYIVMPLNSSKVKVAAVKDYGGVITFCEPTLEARETTLRKVIEKTGATEIHPYNNYRIIEGQATAALELIREPDNYDIIMAPVGGGGLLSGTALSTAFFSKGTKVIAAEPEQANDAYLSFKSKKFVPSLHPDTIADGLRTSLGTKTFPLILEYVSDIVTVPEISIIKAMRILWERMKILTETSSSVTLAALLDGKVDAKGKRIGIILSGGNVDLDDLPW